MKQNRTNNYTRGLACTVEGQPDFRMPFFEIDMLGNPEIWFGIMEHYRKLRLDVVTHRTTKGWHFLSPALLHKMTWKQCFHGPLKGINTECPMVCLRIDPNKYPNEEDIWHTMLAEYWGEPQRNCIEVCDLLNNLFGTHFSGAIHGTPKLVTYPLPVT